MSSEIGKNVKISIFGESHGEAIGVVIDGLPSGENIDTDELIRFMNRRRPGKDIYSTARSEGDIPLFQSGLYNGKTTGTPLCVLIKNTDVKSGDYSELGFKPRPSHADYTAFVKYSGFADMRGGGHFSGRLTAPICVAGGIAKQILARRGIYVGAHIKSVGGIKDNGFNEAWLTKERFDILAGAFPPVLSSTAGGMMLDFIEKVKSEGNSVGGVVECAVIGLDAGLGSPMFEGVENRLAAMLFGVPAVRGVEFGSGFDGSLLMGSENNDEFFIENDCIKTKTNNHGGILGGITTGMPIIMRAAIKPTPSIAVMQQTVDLEKAQNTTLEIKGRHDPCIAIRAVPVIEAAAALVILDLLEER